MGDGDREAGKMVDAASRVAVWNDEYFGDGQTKRRLGGREARLREQRLRKGRAGIAGSGSEGAAERRHTVAADKVLFGIAGTRRGHQQRGKSGGHRSEEFGVSRMAGKGVRREGGPFLDVYGAGTGKEDSPGI